MQIEPIPKQPKRRFLISDGMILIAATAVGIALTRAILPGLETMRTSAFSGAFSGLGKYVLVQYGLSVVSPTFLAWTLALLLMRLRAPRPRLKRVFSQPGAAACAAATLAMVLQAILHLGLLAVGSQTVAQGFFFSAYSGTVSFTIIGGWLVLALIGRFRPEPTWIDRAGRAAAAIWLALAAILWGSYFMI